ncbi:MAG TPA: rhodanese-like domain-containing protein, partial [Terriglobales bacterium]|nr:rhodanese-like domain-containing protein [Terriglobales bacterium]
RPVPPQESRQQAREIALRIATEERIPWISARELIDSLSKQEVTYLIDVRSESEYEARHLPGSLNVPGGQAVQRADDFLAVKNGRLVFLSDQSVRAVMTSYWYRQMGFRDVRVLQRGLEAWHERGGSMEAGVPQSEPLGFEAARRTSRPLATSEANSLLQSSSATALHVGSSADFGAAHLPASQWISRGWLELKLPAILADRRRSILLSCADGRSSTFAARTLAQMGYTEVFVLEGGIHVWERDGYPIEKGLDSCLVEPNDIVLSPSVKGDKDGMRRYLDWEMKLTY